MAAGLRKPGFCDNLADDWLSDQLDRILSPTGGGGLMTTFGDFWGLMGTKNHGD